MLDSSVIYSRLRSVRTAALRLPGTGLISQQLAILRHHMSQVQCDTQNNFWRHLLSDWVSQDLAWHEYQGPARRQGAELVLLY